MVAPSEEPSTVKFIITLYWLLSISSKTCMPVNSALGSKFTITSLILSSNKTAFNGVIFSNNISLIIPINISFK